MKRIIISLLVATVMLSTSGFQIIKTTLNITVRNDTGNTVEGATVRLFETEADYKNETNVAVEGSTDAKGVVKFKELKPIVYYVIAEKGDQDNSGGGERTERLEGKKINKVTIIVQ